MAEKKKASLSKQAKPETATEKPAVAEQVSAKEAEAEKIRAEMEKPTASEAVEAKAGEAEAASKVGTEKAEADKNEAKEETTPESKTEEKETAATEMGEKKETGEETKAAPAPRTEKPEATGAKADEKKPETEPVKKRLFSLPFFSKKKGGEPEVETEKPEKPTKPISAQDVINALDPENKIDEQTSKALAMKLDQQITEAGEKDVVTLKVKKKLILLLIGGLILAMWVVPLVRGLEPLVNKYFGKSEEVVAEENTSQEMRRRVRVKYATGELEGAEALAAKLREGGLDVVEVVEDGELKEVGVGVVAKTDRDALRDEVSGMLASDYEVSSPSAVLSSDSDFDVVVFFKLVEGE